MRKSLVAFLSMIMILSAALVGCSSTASNEGDSILDRVKERGYVVVGVNDKLPGFGYTDSDGTFKGFDIDFAHALAAAIFGDASKVEFRPLSASERFSAVASGDVDVLIRNTTWTTSRDTDVGLNFAPTTFYDGQGMMVRKNSGVKSLKDLDGMTIGVESGTTTELNLTDQLEALGIKGYKIQTFDNADAVVAAYEAGSIDAWTTDKSGLISRQSTLSNPNDHKILNDTMSKEPLGPAVIQGDDKWFDVVKWVTYATIEAEELGITSKNIDSFLGSDDPVVSRFLGEQDGLGGFLGLPDDFAVQIIKQVGNYGEIFDRNLGKDSQFKLDRGINALHTDGGLIYSPPFR
ncbi:amino acid ABC transporter substrate-binding protein [Lottiidibacillus patelloidae]|uniref:Amino acid ABC transporter substrate-binding protein n=1 Tax=Lottiidibacillus patelloidae TaxID=2670334 RepID=A0A263BT16_9BACI|nr:amino acid ABC transporter substrate-binding protein [Lottiidibacillus patelloidae]OZM56708.1 amino acid ABC transporter substrate-binding protein [Lottiidibacillus patelloidae]